MRKNTRTVMKTIFGVIVLLMAVLAALNIYNSMYNLLNKTDYSKIFGYSNHIVIEDNLLPEYKTNDVVIIKDDFFYSAGDIILFEYHGSYKLAEITDIVAGRYIVTDKTNSISPDYNINDNLVVGKAIFNIRGFGKVYDIIASPFAIVFIAFFIAGYFLLTSQIKIRE
jgi:hypothetical protein